VRENRLMNVNIGGYIKKLRLSLGFSLKDVEVNTGISASYLNRIENGSRKCVSLPIIESLAKCYNRSPLELVEVALNESYTEDELPLFETIIYNNEFIISGKRCNKDTKELLMNVIKTIIQCEWTEDTKIEDTLRTINCIEKLKKAIIS